MAEMVLRATGSKLQIISAIHVTSTQAQYDTCLFEFDEAWDGYGVRTAVFYSNPNNIKAMLLDGDNKCYIPWDSFGNSRYLYIGVYGNNGESYLPTQFVEVMYQPGANVDDHLYPPTPGIYEQIVIGLTNKADKSALNDALTLIEGKADAFRVDSLDTQVAALASGSPAGTYADLAALTAANPDHSKIYITLDDGKWCYHNGSAFVAGEVYQAASIAADIDNLTTQLAEKANQADLTALDTIIEAFKTDYAKHNSYNLFSNKSEKNRTSNGVTFTWNDDFTCNVSGTSTSSTAFISIYHSASVIPIWMKLGETYHVYFATTDDNVSLRFSYYKNNSDIDVTHVYVRGNQDITIPEDITGIAIRLVVLSGRTVNGVVTTAMTNALSNKELEAKIKDIEPQLNIVENNIESLRVGYERYNAWDLLSKKDKIDRTSNGVTFTWNEDDSCTVIGTSTAPAFTNLYYSLDTIPDWIDLGETYHVQFSTTDSNINLRFAFYKNNTESEAEYVYVTGDQDVTIPEDITGIGIRLYVLSGRTANGVATASMTNALSNKELEAKILKEPLFYVTFIDDDGFKEALENWEKISDMSGAKITSALITERVGNFTSRVNWDDVKRLTGKGFEFVSHTHAHVDFDITPEEDIIEDFEISQQLLRENGCNVNFLVYPFGRTNATVIDECVKKYFTAGVRIGSAINEKPISPYRLTRYSILNTETMEDIMMDDGSTRNAYPIQSLEYFTSLIDQTLANGGWLIFMSHLHNQADGMHCNEEARQRLADVCKYITSNGGKIVTLSEGYEHYKNRFEYNAKHNASHYIVDNEGNVYDSM